MENLNNKTDQYYDNNFIFKKQTLENFDENKLSEYFSDFDFESINLKDDTDLDELIKFL